jgi:hypothetical protein
VRGARETLLLVGTRLFGAPDAATRAALDGINDPARLAELTDRLLAATGWADLGRAGQTP